jgi:hypothetical protein
VSGAYSAAVTIAVALALVAALPAAAAVPVPAGFTLSAKLSKPAAFVAGKPASIYCASTMAGYYAAAAAAIGRPSAGTAGFSTVGSSQSFLATAVCSYLNRWLAKKPVSRYHLAAALLALLHESELEKGIADESLADCAALTAMPQVVRRFFPLRGVYTIHGLMEDAWFVHGLQPPVYLTRCPAR